MDPKQLRKTLRQLADLVADEAARNPKFADALDELFRASIATEQADRKMNQAEPLPDPFEVFHSRGVAAFRLWLNELDIEELRAIVREHRFDPSRLSDRWKTKERFIKVISERVESRSKQGDVFRHYGTQDRGTEAPGTDLELK